MSPSHARKQGIRYRYYVSSPLLHGQAGRAGSVRRVPAALQGHRDVDQGFLNRTDV